MTPAFARDWSRLPLATPRLRLVPLTVAVAAAALAGAPLPGRTGRGPEVPSPLAPAHDWPTEHAAVVLARAAVAGDASGQWLVALPTGRVVGECGVRAWTGDEPEIGYGLAPSARGRGLGLEAVARLCDHLLGLPGVRGLVAETDAGNAPSLRLLTRLGFVRAGPADTGRLRRTA